MAVWNILTCGKSYMHCTALLEYKVWLFALGLRLFWYFWSQMCISCVSLNANHNLKRNHFIHVLCPGLSGELLWHMNTPTSTVTRWPTEIPATAPEEHRCCQDLPLLSPSWHIYTFMLLFFLNKHCLIALSHSYFVLKSQNKNFPNMQNMSGCFFCQQSFSEVLNNLKNNVI